MGLAFGYFNGFWWFFGIHRNTNLNTPNKTTTIVSPNLQANTNNGQININSQNLNILSSQDTNNTKSNTKLAMVGAVARVVIKVKIDIKNGFGIWLF
jgi:ribosomal protein S9